MTPSRTIFAFAFAFAFAFVLVLPSCDAGPEQMCASGADDPFADCVVAFAPAPDTNYNHDDPQAVLTGPPGGPLDTVSLGCEGEIILSFNGAGIVDGPGPDFIVFENAFAASFPEPGEVSVRGDDGEWRTFDCEPTTLQGCAGVSVTLALPGTGIDPTDPETAGGDPFDLAELSESPEVVTHIRIVDRSRTWWEAQGQDWCDPGQDGKGGFDLDAIAIVHSEDDP